MEKPKLFNNNQLITTAKYISISRKVVVSNFSNSKNIVER